MEGPTSAAVLITLMTSIREAQSLTCYCIGQYCTPSPSDDPTSNDDYGNSISDLVDSSASSYNNSFCEAKKGAKCFSAVTQVEDALTGEVRPDRTFGCLPPDESGFMQCKGNLVPHLNPTAIACCSDEDFCNRKLSPMYEIVDRDPNLGDDSSLGDLMPESVVTTIVLLVSIAVCVVLLIFVVTCVYLKQKTKEDDRRRHQYQLTANGDLEQGGNDIPGIGNCTLSQLIEQSSGSGSGLPLLVQRTIAKQIHFNLIVGQGRYGEVWRAQWRGEDVAVKVFFTTDEASWFRETEIYQTHLMRHENILGFIAADIRGTSGSTNMLLITDFHPIGSLYDFLKDYVNTKNEEDKLIDEEIMLNLAQSAASGLSHLHLEIHGARGKPAIVHRDIKSKNILVKPNLTCAIADFGLAVKYDSSSGLFDFGHHNQRVGTIRYMAPEVVSQTINPHDFEALKQADMYSFALVLWELCSRTRVTSVHKDSSSSLDKKISPYDEPPYSLPYSEFVSSDPSFEDMNAVVNLKKIRPSTSQFGWSSISTVSKVSTLMKECWQANASARPPMLRAKKTLIGLKENLQKKISSEKQQNNLYSPIKDTYNLDKKESISTDSDNYSQNSSLTNSNPSQEMNVRYS